jgi:hypothetical protein
MDQKSDNNSPLFYNYYTFSIPRSFCLNSQIPEKITKLKEPEYRFLKLGESFEAMDEICYSGKTWEVIPEDFINCTVNKF